jgi:hypothetical protein
VTASAEDREERLAEVLLEQEGGDAVGGKERREHPDVGSSLDGRARVTVPATDGEGGTEGLCGEDTDEDEVTTEGSDGADVGEHHEDNTPRGELGEVGVEADTGEDAGRLEDPDEAGRNVERAPHGVKDGDEVVAGLEALDAGDELGDTSPHHDEGEEDVRGRIATPPVGNVRRHDPGATGIASETKNGRGSDGLYWKPRSASNQ